MEEDEQVVVELPENFLELQKELREPSKLVVGSAYATLHARLTFWRRREDERPDSEVQSCTVHRGLRRRGLCPSAEETCAAGEGSQQGHESHPDDSGFSSRTKGSKEKYEESEERREQVAQRGDEKAAERVN